MATGIRDVKAWQESVALAGDVTRAIHACSRRETRQLTDRVLHAALDVASRVAEGCEHTAAPERAARYRQARSALAVLDTLIAVARHAGLLAPAVVAPLTARSTTVARQLGAYLALAERCEERSA